MKEIRMRAVRRAIRYEGEVRHSKKKIVCKCIKELEKRRPAGEEGRWEKKRRELVEKVGMSKEQLKEGIEVDARDTEGHYGESREERKRRKTAENKRI